MSCHLLDRKDIDRIVYMLLPPGRDARGHTRYGKQILSNGEYDKSWHEPGTPEDRTNLGRLLWRMNLVSCQIRYPDDESGQRPGPFDLFDDEILAYTWTWPENHCFEGNFLALGSLLYQSSEANFDETGWGKEAYDLVEAAYGRVAANVLSDRIRDEAERMKKQLLGQAV